MSPRATSCCSRPENLVPADGILLEARDLHVDQALLTGESFPVERAAAVPATSFTDIVDASNALFNAHVHRRRNGAPARLSHRRTNGDWLDRRDARA
jgi:magnesium-transporting ATPase (P-type)